jgi:hypothetical protein
MATEAGHMGQAGLQDRHAARRSSGAVGGRQAGKRQAGLWDTHVCFEG